MSHRPLRRALLATCCVAALGPGAWAAPPEAPAPTAEQRAAAAGYYEAGVTHFKAKDYESAIVEFTRAYRIDPSPTLVFNMARAFEEMRRYGPARDFYQRYLALAPNAPDRPQVEATIAALGHLAKPAATPAPVVAPEPVAAPVTAQVAPAAPASGTAPWGWVALGVGAAALGGFAVLGVLANEEDQRLDDLAKDPARTPAAWDDAQSKGAGYALGADILLGVGLLGAAAGVTLLVLDRGDASVSVGPTGVGLQASF